MHLKHNWIVYGWMFLISINLSALQAGVDYERLPHPIPTNDHQRVEVIEFFWYGCLHCYQLEADIDAWQKRLPDKVILRREHILWPGNPGMESHFKIFATLRALNLLAKQPAVFEAVQNGVKLEDRASLLAWVSKQDIDQQKFQETYDSFAVQAQVKQALQLTRTYRVNAVPMFVVNGTYVTSSAKLGSVKRLFEVLDDLIKQERRLLASPSA